MISNQKLYSRYMQEKLVANYVLNVSNLFYIIIIIIMSHHQHGYPWPSLATPSYRPSLPAGPQGYPVSTQSSCMYVRASRPAFARPCEGVHRSTSLMSSSLLLQQCPACQVCLMVLKFLFSKCLELFHIQYIWKTIFIAYIRLSFSIFHLVPNFVYW